MSRYKPNSPWTDEKILVLDTSRILTVQCADALDTKTGDTFREGAFRILVSGKPIRGKGGTVPFYGETAWNDADRKASDIAMQARYAA